MSAPRLLIAFSGGPDSTALLRLAAAHVDDPASTLLAAHVDHRLDDASADRAERARGLAAELGVPFRLVVLLDAPPRGVSVEEWARIERYAALERLADETGCAWILTAHHADDQAETVLLRLAFGSGLEGLAAIWPRRGRVVRPLLDLRRDTLRRLAEPAPRSPFGDLVPVDDPANRDPRFARTLVRHGLLPHLERSFGGDDLVARLGRLADTARRAGRTISGMLERRLRLQIDDDGSVSIDREALDALPTPLVPHAMTLLHRRAGAARPPAARASTDLLRRLEVRRAAGGGPIGVDAGGGWRWQADGARLWLVRSANPPPRFAYTLRSPSTTARRSVSVPEIHRTVRLEPIDWRSVDRSAWIGGGRSTRTALALPSGARIVVRNRRPGDRIRPLGAPGSKSLKDLFIDRRIPRHRRDHIPLLVVDDRVAWIPGVALDERFRVADDAERAWGAELLPIERPSLEHPADDSGRSSGRPPDER